MGICGKMKPMKKVLFTILILFIASCSKEIFSGEEVTGKVADNGGLIEENYDQDGKIIKNMEKNMTLVTIKTSVGEIKLELNDDNRLI